MLHENHERRRDEIARQIEWDTYSAGIAEWTGSPDVGELLPPGSARCVHCGRDDLLAVSTTDGRRVLLEEVGDGGAWAVSEGLARLSEAGDYVEHLRACGARS